ncbi:MAG: Gfo/Idh/MocA family oxidoreductase [Lentisphaerae bacterium]|nr:Gfo/Idh/MocA family oxidoreductase [Lentisphaerota bacterium]
MKNLKIGLIGIGLRGRIGRHLHKPENGTEVIAGADTNLKAHEDIKEFVPDIALFTDYREMLKIPELDAVIIATPDYLHEEMAVASLEAGKAVYLEKPMAITLEGCDRILETAMRTGSKLFVGHNMRHKPLILKMKSIIDSGVIGELRAAWCRHFVGYGGDAYFRDWHSEQKYSTGLLLQKGSHDIDVMHWLMGSYSKSVVGMGMLSVYNRCERRSPDTPGNASWNNAHYPPLEQTGFSPVIDVEDHSMVMMQLENGAQMCYMQCHYTPDSERNYTFIGTKGRIENYGHNNGPCEIHVWTQRGPRETPDIVYHLKAASGFHGGADLPTLANFVDFVRFGAKTNTSPIAARQSVAVGYLGHKSMRTGCNRQDIPELPPEMIAYFENNQRAVSK